MAEKSWSSCASIKSKSIIITFNHGFGQINDDDDDDF